MFKSVRSSVGAGGGRAYTDFSQFMVTGDSLRFLNRFSFSRILPSGKNSREPLDLLESTHKRIKSVPYTPVSCTLIMMTRIVLGVEENL